jgi:hypothetical protein
MPTCEPERCMPGPSGPVHQLSGDLLVRDGEAPQTPRASRSAFQEISCRASSIPCPSLRSC